MQNITVIINNRDLYTWPKEMVNHILKYEYLEEIIIIDNNSSYYKTLEWYDNNNNFKVIRLNENLGHTAPWDIGMLDNINTDLYVVTDPDLDLSLTPTNTLTHLFHCLCMEPLYPKIGLGFKIDDLPVESPYYKWCSEGWEFKRNLSTIINNLYRNIIVDTTFALYDRTKCNTYIKGGGSTIYPYIVRHLPYYEIVPTIEFQYYLDRCNSSCTYKSFINRLNLQKNHK